MPRKPYKYKGPTRYVGFRCSATISEDGTAIRDKLLDYFTRLATGIQLNKEEIDWCNGVLDP